MRITVGNIKGGVAKTTTAVFLALELAKEGDRVLLVDADPEQVSAFSWSEDAGEAWPDNCHVITYDTHNLYKRIAPMLDNYDHLVIDTSPKNPVLLRQALLLSDKLIIPISPSPMEMRELQPTLELAEEVGITSPVGTHILLVKTIRGTRSKREARQALKDNNLPLMEAEVHQKEFYKLAFGTVPDETEEYSAVLTELRSDGVTV